MRILVTNPSETAGASIELSLIAHGFNVEALDDPLEAMDFARSSEFDAIVIETEPKDGLIEHVRDHRQLGLKSPVIFVSGSHDIGTICSALEVADDYVRMPMHIDELIARITAVARRSKGHAAKILDIGALQLDLTAKEAFVSGQSLHLTGKEYAIVEALALRCGSVMTKEQLLDTVYGGRDEPELKIIDVFLCKIRKKLRDAGFDLDLLPTIWGRGYMLRRADQAA